MHVARIDPPVDLFQAQKERERETVYMCQFLSWPFYIHTKYTNLSPLKGKKRT